MRKIFALILLTFIAVGLCRPVKAQKINVASISEKKDLHNFYKMMKEAFPLAYNDPAAPRFIFFDNDRRFVFGIGGYVQATGVYDFNGVEDYNFFTTSAIAPKGHQAGSSFGMTVNQSRIFFKLVGDTDRGRLVSYIEMQFEGPSNTPKLNQAFVQFKGFLVGQAWSTFCDMPAVPTTIDQEGPSSSIEVRQPQVRYTHKFNDKWQASLALEYAVPDYTNQADNYTANIRQRIPDIPLVAKYTFKNGGHLQGGAILRNIYYKDNVRDKDKVVTGWGTTLSGVIPMCQKTSFMFQGVYGKAIANYIQDISDLGYDLIPNPDKNGRLKASAMWGFFAAVQQNWTPDLYSTLTYSYARMENIGDLASTNYKYAQYAGVNLLWNFTEYGTTGIEYVFGRRNNFDKNYGNANRINAMLQYRF